MSASIDPSVDIEGYLARHEQKELVRFVTIGSVDDGKSTLIGRMLHDTHMVYEDQLAAVKKASALRGGGGEIDFSLLTDGLVAEREQGITIDVAYRYFSTSTRKFIIADTPGHEQYTRNMATGASTADIAVILLDARLGILPQSRRHAAIASLLGISELVVAVNKMDLVGYGEAAYQDLERGFRQFLAQLRFDGVTFVPVSAKMGDNVVSKSDRTPWYEGRTLLALLETLPRRATRDDEPFRFPVQTVLRPHLDYRGFAGYVARGVVRAGDEVVVLPSGRRTRVAGIDSFEGTLTHAFAPMSVTLRLADEVDVSRGEMIAPWGAPPTASVELEATLVWLSERAFDPARKLLAKHTSRWVPARIAAVLGKASLETLELEPTVGIALNDIVRIRLSTSRPLLCDPYAECRATGAFILVDALSNATVGAGMIEIAHPMGASRRAGAVTSEDRAIRLGHRAALVRASGDAERVERSLFDRGVIALALGAETSTPAVVGRLLAAGVVVVVADVDDVLFGELTEIATESIIVDAREAADVIAQVSAAVALPELMGQGGGI